MFGKIIRDKSGINKKDTIKNQKKFEFKIIKKINKFFYNDFYLKVFLFILIFSSLIIIFYFIIFTVFMDSFVIFLNFLYTKFYDAMLYTFDNFTILFNRVLQYTTGITTLIASIYAITKTIVSVRSKVRGQKIRQEIIITQQQLDKVTKNKINIRVEKKGKEEIKDLTKAIGELNKQNEKIIKNVKVLTDEVETLEKVK